MPLTFALRRHRSVVPVRYEYFYLTAETAEPVLDFTVIKPKLPGNDASTLRGPNSTNFRFNLGSMEVGVRIAGFLVPIQATDLPDLAGEAVTSIHAPYLLKTGSAVSTPATSLAGKDQRSALYDFIADQAVFDATNPYDEFGLIWPDWGATSSSRSGTDASIAGQASRFWEGNVLSLRTRELAGQIDQYMYDLTFTVGDVF